MSTFRADRLITLGVVGPTVRLLKPRRDCRIPILMYHGIREDRNTRLTYFETNTSSKMFRAQMQFLSDRGYKAISLSEAVQSISIGKVNNKHVVITLDDGYRDLYTTAMPVSPKMHLPRRYSLFLVSRLRNLTGLQARSS